MRIAPIPPAELTATQRPLDQHARALLGARPIPFAVTDQDDALIGPFPPMLTFAEYAEPLLRWFTATDAASLLSPQVREVAILSTGARYGSAYVLYAHGRVARAIGLPDHVVRALTSGERPDDLGVDELLAHDLAARLRDGGVLPDGLYRTAVDAFGAAGTAELVFLIAQYTSVSLLVNTYDVPVPPDAG